MSIASKLTGKGINPGWLVVSAPFLAYALTVGTGQYAFGLFVEPLETEFGWNRTQINASLSFTAVGSLAAPFIGRYMDRHGAKKVMIASLMLIGLSFLLRPLMTDLWHWYALSFLQFIGFAGAAMLPAGRLVGIWFQRTRGRVMGITAMGNNFGGLVFPLFTGLIFVMSSWRGAYITYGILAFAVAAFAFFVVSENPNRDQPPSMGNQPKTTTVTLTGWTLREALHSRSFYFIAMTIMLGTFTYSTVLPQIINHLTNEGIPQGWATLGLSLVALFGMGGKFVMGFVAERISARYALMIDLTGQATFLTAMLFVGLTPWLLWVIMPLFGFFLGAFGALFQLIVQDAFGIRYFGSIMGIINITMVVSFGVGPLLAGLTFDMTGSYHVAFITVACFFLTGVLSLTQAKTPVHTAP
ncbi:MAG: MFS transporter [Chloroflexi bacterium]|nr:MFS transporter [Chloroflexota bacterium]MDA1226577.1 MFS transporter [Chloroflexota bacterium]